MLNTLSNLLIVIVVVLHGWFMVLEMFLWTKPVGLKLMRLTQERAETSKVLAMNQGLYNGLLGAGLIAGLLYSDPAISIAFKYFFLVCIIIAGIFGGLTSSRKILYIQAMPAILALLAVYLS